MIMCEFCVDGMSLSVVRFAYVSASHMLNARGRLIVKQNLLLLIYRTILPCKSLSFEGRLCYVLRER